VSEIDLHPYLTILFTKLCHAIEDYGTQSFEEALGDFQFLFGGWSWKANAFKLWKLSYNHGAKAFTHSETDSSNMTCTFIGDKLDIVDEALTNELISNRKVMSRRLDMEPFNVLIQMIKDEEHSTIGGAVQLAKIHPPGVAEFLGVYWPNINGKKTFLGKDVSVDNNPAVRFVDPDTAEIVENSLPELLHDITKELYGNNVEFVNKCYPNGEQKTDLTKREKANLKSIFEQVAYNQFLARQVPVTGDDL
jgi:hypothetical protein